MSEPIDWLPDGTPCSPRFGDRYHSSANHGLDQARDAFLGGCGLPAAWAGQAQWRILETGFGFGLNFLVTWAAWRADPARPRMLHFVSTEAWPVDAADLLRWAQHLAPQDTQLQPLARQLAAQFRGLLPGVHRLSFEGGQVLLTLCIGDTQALLRQQAFTVDAVYLDGFSPDANPGMWDVHTLKAVARCCRRGTRLATWTVARAVRDALAQCGFEARKVPGTPPKRDNLQAVYDPRWELRASAPAAQATPSRCIVIGGGLAGASVAASLARRGWQVDVLDRGAEPAAGASGLPAGLFAPHVSPDDSLLSRLSRSGVRLTRQAAGALLQEGVDWAPSGVLEHCLDGKHRLPADAATPPGSDWSTPADAARLAAAGLPGAATANWHPSGGWVRPARLVAALLAQPGIRWRGNTPVEQLEQAADAEGRPLWRLRDAAGRVQAEAALVVVAAGAGSIGLCGPFWPGGPLRPLRGQVTWGRAEGTPGLPPFPVNGHGNLVPQVPTPEGAIWVLGSTFERGQSALPKTPAEEAEGHAANLQRLQGLLPGLAERLQPRFDAPAELHAWAAVRCTVPDRLPVVGPVDPLALPGLWASTAMGARGLTLAVLCGELLAARLHGEPPPLDDKLARALGAERLTTA